MAGFVHPYMLGTTSSSGGCSRLDCVLNHPCKFCLERQGAASMNVELKAKLKFLQCFSPGPLSDSFRGDLKLMGSDNIPVYAHRFIMSGKSPVFKKMFETEMEENETGVVQIVDFTAPVLRAMVNFCYTAEITFTATAPAEEVLKVAHKYDIPQLKVVSEDDLSRGFNSNNICLRLWLASMYGSKKLELEASKYVRDHFETIFPVIRKQIVPWCGFNFVISPTQNDQAQCESPKQPS